MPPLLQDKNIVIYGAGGALGGGIARVFAREGARVFLAGRTRAPLESVASDIAAGGGAAEVTELDTLDEEAVEEHAAAIADRAGSLDGSFNLTSRGDVQGTPLIEMSPEDWARPIEAGARSNFLTARAAARRMVEQGSGAILMLDSGSARGGYPLMGGTGAADAATDNLVRSLAAEIGPRGVRVIGIYTAGVPETFGLEHDTNPARMATGMGPQDIERALGPLTQLKRLPRLAEVADTAAFLLSDRAGGITGTFVSVSCGLIA